MKATVESRGLMIDDRVVKNNWYEYYLIRNRTYYGLLWEVDHDGPDTVPYSPVIYAYSFLSEQRFDGLVQLPDLGIYITDSSYIHKWDKPFNISRKIRQAAFDDDAHRLWLLDEYGFVWVDVSNSNRVELIRMGTDIVSIHIPQDEGFKLYAVDRSGKLRYFQINRRDPSHELKQGTITLGNIPTVELVSGPRENLVWILARNGALYLYNKATGERHSGTKPGSYLSGHIRSDFSALDTLIDSGPDLRVVRATKTMLLTADRTLYSMPIHNRNGYGGYGRYDEDELDTPIPNRVSRHRTQTVNQYEDGNYGYAILDPH